MDEVAVEQLTGTVEVFACIGTWMPLAGWKCCDVLTAFALLPDGMVRCQHGGDPEHAIALPVGDVESFRAWIHDVHGRSEDARIAAGSLDR